MKMSYKNLIHILFFTICDVSYCQSPFIDTLITTTLQSSPTAHILCILKTSNQDLKKRTDHFSTKNEKGELISANNIAKGALGEIASDVALMEREMIPLHKCKRSVQDGWGETGIDGVFKRGNEYFKVEAKYGSATLNPGDISTGLPKQMSDPWIKGTTRLINAVGSQSIVNDILNSGYKRLMAKINQDGSVIYSYLTKMPLKLEYSNLN